MGIAILVNLIGWETNDVDNLLWEDGMLKLDQSHSHSNRKLDRG